MNLRASISLTALLSLVVGLLILFQLGTVVVKYIGGESESKVEQLPELASFVLSSIGQEEGKSMTKSMRADKEDLFLFFSKGTTSIELLYKGEGEFGSFEFARPEECNDVSCVCYCRGGSYWQASDESPFLILTTLRSGNQYTCTSLTCEVQQEDIEFVNSLGNKDYTEQIYPFTTYKPFSLDVLMILQRIDDLKKNNPSARIPSYFENPFFDSSAVVSYTHSGQDRTYTLLFDDYAWSGGYVLGGYGVIMSEKDLKAKILSTPPVTLRLEHHGDGIVGICLQETCLFEEDLEVIQKKRTQRKLQETIVEIYDDFEIQLQRTSTCKTDGSGVVFACDPTRDIYDLFALDGVADLKPQFKFTLAEDTGDEKNKISKIQFQYEFDGETVVLEELTTASFFVCQDEKTDVRSLKDMTLIAHEGDYVFTLENDGSCLLKFSTQEPVVSEQTS